MEEAERVSWWSGVATYALLAGAVVGLTVRALIKQRRYCNGGGGGGCCCAPARHDEEWRLLNRKAAPSGPTQLNYIQRAYAAVMLLFALGRVSWCLLRVADAAAADSLVAFALNRFCFVAFFSAFCLIVFYLAESLHKRYFGESPRFLPTLGWAFLLVNALLWLISIALVIVYIVQQSQSGGNVIQEGNIVYESTIVLVIAVDLLLAISFSVYGFRLLYLRQKSRLTLSSAPPSSQGPRELILSTVSTLLIAASFLTRVVLFSWRPITGNRLDPIAFRVVGYFAAEALPAALQLLLLYSIKQRQVQRSEYIDDLYDGFSDPSQHSAAVASKPPTTSLPCQPER